ncbi:hypothetical protein LOTGIDRAFT_235451 [Lottia gigantea]|uniref:Ribonuclease H2 subunit B n=1 Tax=Lottia gigantea TaxID=225164 RepID=V3Z6L0_LOTGI|nr:hypothetical protein LOTGIDRAFT_235451 [Lottia gigantea]ESO86408.1 hypothetical protein LOTGIDRAFT_235451 [Lottia gigantea]
MPKRPASRQSVSKLTPDPDQAQWVFIVNDKVLEFNGDNENKPIICQLRHPKTDEGSYYLFSPDGKDIYEVIKYKEEFRSWLIDQTVQQDGGIVITSPVDPVFLVLPYLIQKDKCSKFMTLDQIVVDEKFSECRRLQECQGLEELHQVADIKGDDDFKAYRYNEEKTMSWLKAKVDILTDHIIKKELHVNTSQSSNFVKSKKEENIERDVFVKYSYGIISDYLPLTLSKQLHQYLGIPEVEEKPKTSNSTEEPPAKRVKLEEIKPLEDYSKQNKDKKKTTLSKKLSNAQKKLEKVDKSGMKSLASFFSPKPKS